MTASDDTPTAARLLLVDDDRLILGTLAAGLRHMGYQVAVADCVEEAETLLSGGLRPDLAIVDVRLPGRDGLSLAQRLAEVDHVPFLMLSAYGDAATVERATHSGALGYLVKPLALHQIQPAIETALQRAGELDGLRRARTQLQSALDADREINVATGITMVQYRMARKPAFELLRNAARAQRRKLSAVAQEIVRACELLHR
ncbi:ANTAR domain-containing response regulator [Alicycliphilus sp. T452]